MSNRILIAIVVILMALVLVALFSPKASTSRTVPADSTAPASTTTTENKEPVARGEAPSSVIIGHDTRKVHTIFTTRKRDVLYQALVRYFPVDVRAEDVPGLSEIAQAYARQGRDLPQSFRRIDQETEMTTDNLGEPLRFISEIKLYTDPSNVRVVAYDMAQTTGGQPQRMVGHLSPKGNGFTIEVYRGGQLADKQEITFVRDTFIPVEYEFIHQWYEHPDNKQAKATRESIKWSIFVPEAMAQVLLLVKPLDDEMVPVGNKNYNCTHFDVRTVSTQSSEGIYAAQEMWFDKDSGRLMKRQDFDASLDPGDAPVSEREPYQRIDFLGRLSELPVKPPAVPYKTADFLLDRDFVYNVKARGLDIGHIRVRFARFEAGKSAPDSSFIPPNLAGKPAYFSTSHVRVNTGESQRVETAVTLYDENWHPLHYETRGQENAGAKLDYQVTADLGGGKIQVATHRDALPELKRSAAYQGAMAACEAGLQAGSGDEAVWRDPLKRIPVDDDAQSQELQAPRLLDQRWTRALLEGTFISDFNRIEHLMLLACRLPQPPPPLKDDDAPQVKYQKAAIYLVRQNRCGVLLFDTRPEPKPKLTERQKRRMSAEELNEPPLFVANASAAMMPCRMLLMQDGTVLELAMKYGSGDVDYTLDHPIMRRREEAAQKRKLQEGPRLLRPPWF